MAKAIAVTRLGVVGGTVYNVGNYVLEATIADAVVAAGLGTVTQSDVPDDIDVSTPEALLNALGNTPSLIVVSASVGTKPTSPNEKDAYIVPAGSAWAALDEAYDNQLALFERGGWKYITPKFGWQVRNKADNGVLWYDGDSWEVSGSGGGGSGTVTSVGLSLPNIFTISGSPVTTSGTLAATLANQSANQIFAGPSSGGAAAPSFRALVSADIPDISSVYATKAYADGLVVGLLDDRGNFDASSNTFPAAGGSGSAGAILKGDLWTISVAGTLGGTSVTPGDIVRALTDTPGQTASNWAVSETNIGYAALNAALNNGQIYIGNGSNVGTARTLSGDVTVDNTGVTAIGNAKVTNAMLAGSIDLTAKVAGVLPVANGGTGLSALGSALQVLRVNAGGTALEYAAGGGGASGANPTASVGLSAVNGVATTFLRSDGAPALDQGIAPTWTARHIWSVNGAVSAPGLTATGTWFTGGSATTTKPQLLIEPSGATSTGWSTSGTGLGVNAASGFTGNIVDFQLNGTSKAKIDQNGTLTLGNPVLATANAINMNDMGIGQRTLVNGLLDIMHGSTAMLEFQVGYGVVLNSSKGTSFGVGLTTVNQADTAWTRHAAAVWRATNGSTGAGSVVLGTSTVGSIGTSGVGVLAIANGTAPTSSPADTGQIYAADWNGAGTSAIHVRNEEGHIVKICSQAVAALTNNVTSGGTNDQVDTWSDLTTYATDAAAIRNAIYQLSRKLAEVVTAQRSNGLFR